MKKIIIVRSASFQQLDLNLPEIRNRFPDHMVYLLTHAHGVKLAEKYNGIDQIVIYPEKSGFDETAPVKELSHVRFDAVIVPVTNLSGVGFDNVFKFALTFDAKELYMCNMVSDIKKISKKQIQNGDRVKKIYTLVSIGLTVAVIPVFAIMGLARFVSCKMKMY